MTEPTHVVCLSDEDEEDCVIESITYKANDEKPFNFYQEVGEENQLLANFIERCLNLERSVGMSSILKNLLLPMYYKVEKSVRTGKKVQRALQRANNLVLSEPHNKFTHINDLCQILKALQVKKKVPFITLSTGVSLKDKKKSVFSGKDSNKNGHKRANTELTNASSSKKGKLNNNVISLDTNQLLKENQAISIPKSNNVGSTEAVHSDFDEIDKSMNENPGTSKELKSREDTTSNTLIETNESLNHRITNKNIDVIKPTSNVFNDTTDTLDESTVTEGCSQNSCNSEEGSLLVPKEDRLVVVDPAIEENQEKIKNLEKKIAYYKKQIEKLDEYEVVDDSHKSPYILSERLKAAVVVLYKELCELTGSQVEKEREIRLQVIDGHPPGPTRVLERFLNDNMNSNGDLPFPDFCDVVNCVTEANEKDDLGWTRAQIMKEAYLLFTHYGRALQKRRQNREYKDLLRRVKTEEEDPADNDPELLARLEENKRISVKKESELLERYTMMQLLPSKPKQNQQVTTTQETKDAGSNNNNTGGKNETTQMDSQKFEDAGLPLSDNDKSIMNPEAKESISEQISTEKFINKVHESSESKEEIKSNISNEQNIECNKNQDCDTSIIATSICEDTSVQPSNPIQSSTNLKSNVDHSSSTDISENIFKQEIDTKLQTESYEKVSITDVNKVCSNSLHNHKIITKNTIDTDNIVDTTDTASGKKNEHETDMDENELLIKEIKKEPEENLMSMLRSLGDTFSVSIETISDPFLIVEISSHSSMSDEE